MGELRVRRTDEADLEELLPVYVAATADEATNAWVTAAGPVPGDVYAGFLSESLRRYLSEDEVWIAERGGRVAGVSVWQRVRSTDRFEAEARAVAAMAEAADLAVLRRAETALRITGTAHPNRPHLYLYLIAVVPEHRGTGAGGAMLRERLGRADEAGEAAYLEASTEDSARLYKRCGFEERGGRLRLPEDGPLLIPMWREPAAS